MEEELEREFSALDANGDGVVTLEEYTAALSGGGSGSGSSGGGAKAFKFAEMDANGDGVVTLQEFKSGVLARIGNTVSDSGVDGVVADAASHSSSTSGGDSSGVGGRPPRQPRQPSSGGRQSSRLRLMQVEAH